MSIYLNRVLITQFEFEEQRLRDNSILLAELYSYVKYHGNYTKGKHWSEG